MLIIFPSLYQYFVLFFPTLVFHASFTILILRPMTYTMLAGIVAVSEAFTHPPALCMGGGSEAARTFWQARRASGTACHGLSVVSYDGVAGPSSGHKHAQSCLLHCSHTTATEFTLRVPLTARTRRFGCTFTRSWKTIPSFSTYLVRRGQGTWYVYSPTLRNACRMVG
jgi:hypothetical protein